MTALPIESTEFSIHDAVVAEMRRNKSPNPYVIASAVIAKVDNLADAKAALEKALPLYVRTLSAQVGVAPLTIVTGGGHGTPADQAQTAPSGPGTGRPHAEASKNARRAGANRRRAWLVSRVSIGPNAYKFLGDFGVKDCETAAEVRREHAKANEQRADWFDRAAAELRKHKVGAIRLLPEAVLDGLS